MSDFTLFEAAKRMRNPLSIGLMKAIVTEDELFSFLPFVPKDGDSWSYEREKALPNVEWVAPNHTTLAESTAKTDQVTVPKREIASNMDLYNFVLAQQNGGAQRSMQMFQKARAAGKELSRALIKGGFVTGHALSSSADPFSEITAVTAGPWIDSNRYGPGAIEYDAAPTKRYRFRGPGDRTWGEWVEVTAGAGTYKLPSDNPSKFIKITIDASATADGVAQIEFTSTTNEPDGIESMLPDSQIIPSTGVDGDDYSFEVLDALLDKVKVRDGLAYIMPPALYRKHKALERSLGGTGPEFLEVGSFDADGMETRRKVRLYEGIPILRNENVTEDESKGASTTLSSVYLVSLRGPMNMDGNPKGLYAGAYGGSSLNADLDPRSRMVLGMQMIPVGQLEGKNAQRWRLVWYGGFGLGSELAAARAKEIKTAA